MQNLKFPIQLKKGNFDAPDIDGGGGIGSENLMESTET